VLAERAAEVSLDFVYHELGRSVDAGVQWTAKAHNDALYVFTCNADKGPCRVTIKGIADRKVCKVVGEARELPIVDGEITDDWAPFGVHLYEFPCDC